MSRKTRGIDGDELAREILESGGPPVDHRGRLKYQMISGKSESPQIYRATYGHSEEDFWRSLKADSPNIDDGYTFVPEDEDPEEVAYEAYLWALTLNPELRPNTKAPAEIGPMSQRTRSRSFIKPEQFWNAYDALKFANHLGHVMNVKAGLSFSELGWNDDEVCRDNFAAYVDCFRQWCRREEVPAIYIYVLERSQDLGLHAHMLFHIPHDPQNKTLARFRNWAKGAADRFNLHRGQRRRSGQPWVKTSYSNTDRSFQWCAFKYMMKGIDPDAKFFHEGRRRNVAFAELAELEPQFQGHIPFMRVGVCQKLNRASRIKKADFEPLDKDPNEWPRGIWDAFPAG